MIRYFKRGARDTAIKALSKFEKNCWIHVVNPSESDIASLSKNLNMDPDNLIAGIDPHEVPRIDEEDGKVFIYVKSTTPEPDNVLQTFLIVIGNNFILTLSKEEPIFLKKILIDKTEFTTSDKSKCIIALLTLLSDALEKESLDIVRSIRSRRERVSEELREKDADKLLEFEDVLNDYVSSYYHMTLVYERIPKRIKFKVAHKEEMEDLLIEAKQGFNVCRSSLKKISNIRKYYSIVLTNKLNKTITILTVFTIIIAIPAAISGLYGMNLQLPFAKDPSTFYYMLLLITIIWFAFTVYLKKKRVL